MSRPAPHRLRQLFETFLAPIDVVPFDAEAGKLHGVLRHQLRHQPIGERDLLIAATAPALAVVDWSA